MATVKIKVKKTTGEGDNPKEKTPVITSKEQLDKENETARRLAIREGHFDAKNVYAARKVGDPAPQYIDSRTGKPAVATPTKPKRLTLPNNVSTSDVKQHEDSYWYEDPQTGDVVDVDRTVVNKKVPKEQVEADKAKMAAKIRLKKSK